MSVHFEASDSLRACQSSCAWSAVSGSDVARKHRGAFDPHTRDASIGVAGCPRCEPAIRRRANRPKRRLGGPEILRGKSMFAPVVHFSLTTLNDPARHRAYNAWRALDYDPELLVQPGVAGGASWVPLRLRLGIHVRRRTAGFHTPMICARRKRQARGPCGFFRARLPDGDADQPNRSPTSSSRSKATSTMCSCGGRASTDDRVHLTISRMLRHDVAAEQRFAGTTRSAFPLRNASRACGDP